jgi:hypothetical protein
MRPATAALLATLSLTLVFTARPVAAEAPYEPNDSIPSAAGPLAIGATYTAAIESPSDRDYFYFYVAAVGDVDVTTTVSNLGGGTQASEVDLRILDFLGTFVAGDLTYVNDGERRASTISLSPGKYFAEVHSFEGFGDTYSFTTGGGEGAFAGYGPVAARCETARRLCNAPTPGSTGRKPGYNAPSATFGAPATASPAAQRAKAPAAAI